MRKKIVVRRLASCISKATKSAPPSIKFEIKAPDDPAAQSAILLYSGDKEQVYQIGQGGHSFRRS